MLHNAPEVYMDIALFKCFPSGESRYNLGDLLLAPPPLESEEEPPVYKESEEVTLAVV